MKGFLLLVASLALTQSAFAGSRVSVFEATYESSNKARARVEACKAASEAAKADCMIYCFSCPVYTGSTAVVRESLYSVTCRASVKGTGGDNCHQDSHNELEFSDVE